MTYSAAALVCALIGSGYDIREHRIPNLLTGTSIIAGLLLHGILGGWGQLGSSALAGLIGGLVFALFYRAGGMGAGDVKLMIAVGCLMGLAPLRLMLLATSLAGAIFGLAIAIYRGRLRQTLTNVASILAHHGREGLSPHPELSLANAQTLRLPFALPIAVGCAAALWGS
jgi:prepilin peptidase CpaA